MNDVAFVVAAYGVVLGALILYGFSLRRRIAGAARRMRAIDRRVELRSEPDVDRAAASPQTGSGLGLDPDPPSR